MNSRRSFFKTLASVVAAVAIAPEIAFRRKLELPEAKPISGDLWICYTYDITSKIWKQHEQMLDRLEDVPKNMACTVRFLQSPSQPLACSPSSTTRS